MKKVFLLFLLLKTFVFAQGYICAVGGGSEDYNDWSDKPYGWIVQKADSGKIIILGADDATDWLPTYFKHLGAKEAYNKRISNRTTADQQSTYDEIITAKAIFIRGGDQYDYLRYWNGTKTEEAIKYVFNNGGVVAGTSAGAMVLGTTDFTAKYGTITSRDALRNPYGNKLDLDTTFLNFVPDVLFDTHFIERGRLGRMLCFLNKLCDSDIYNTIGVGIDDMTALCIDKDGIGEVMGSGAVAFFYTDGSFGGFGDEVCRTIFSDQLTAGFTYNIANRKIVSVPPTAKTIEYPKMERVKPYVIFSGSDNIAQNLNNGFKEFPSASTQPFLILYDSQSKAIADTLIKLFSNADSLLVSKDLTGNQSAVDKIKSFTKFVFIASDYSSYTSLIDTSKTISKVLHAEISKEETACYFWGSASKLIGEYFVDNTDKDGLASYHGQMTIRKGLNLLDDFIFQPMLWQNDDLLENRVSALLYGMMRNRKPLGIFLTDDQFLKTDSYKMTLYRGFDIPFIIVNACSTTIVDSSVYKAGSGYRSRQVVAMNNLRYGLCNRAQSNYSFHWGEWDLSDAVEENTTDNPSFVLANNYPNPFNSQTVIRYSMFKAGNVKLTVHDILGKEIFKLNFGFQPEGSYKYIFNAEAFNNKILTSGVYLFRLETDSYSLTKKMLLLK